MARRLITTIFIACEGTNTEPIYFERINEEIEDEGIFELTIYPDKSDKSQQNPRTHALGLIQEAQSRAVGFDELWAVFDKDGYTQHPQTFTLAQGLTDDKPVNIGFSSIAFEQWVLLHFERSDVAFAGSRDIIQHLINQNYYPNYEKTANVDVYTTLKDKTWFAIRNAAWLRMRLRQLAQLPGTAIYLLNPYTDIDILIKKLLAFEEDLEWSWIGNPFTLGNQTYTLTVVGQDVHLRIDNHANARFMVNMMNLDAHFLWLRNEVEPVSISIAANFFVDPNASSILIISPTTPIQAGDLFVVKSANPQFFIEL